MATANKPVVVLIVEDEPLLRLAAFDMVEDAGFTAVQARDADEAVIILEQRPDITILFTDIDMPGAMNGLKLAAAVRDRWPPIHIIVVSGHLTPAPGELPDQARFFAKPYRDRDVTAAMAAFG